MLNITWTKHLSNIKQSNITKLVPWIRLGVIANLSGKTYHYGTKPRNNEDDEDILKKMESPVSGMSTGGNYGSHASSQRKVCETVHSEYVSKFLDKILTNGNDTIIKMADFGAADCINSAHIYKSLVDQCKDIALVVHIVDLPQNDWEKAREVCQENGLTVLDSAQSEVAGVKFIPKSFYEQCLPRASINVAFTSIATHWLSSTEGVKMEGVVLSSVVYQHRIQPDVLTVIQNRAHMDGVNFLSCRAEELVNGGILVMGNSGSVVDSRTGELESTYRALFETMSDIVVDWIKLGKCSDENACKLFFPLVYQRSIVEWKKCFDDPHVRSKGLVIKDWKYVHMESPLYQKEYRDCKISSSSADMDFATAYTKSMLAWGKDLLLRAFTEQQLEAFLQELTDA